MSGASHAGVAHVGSAGDVLGNAYLECAWHNLYGGGRYSLCDAVGVYLDRSVGGDTYRFGFAPDDLWQQHAPALADREGVAQIFQLAKVFIDEHIEQAIVH